LKFAQTDKSVRLKTISLQRLVDQLNHIPEHWRLLQVLGSSGLPSQYLPNKDGLGLEHVLSRL
jgi:hypothetical protein